MREAGCTILIAYHAWWKAAEKSDHADLGKFKIADRDKTTVAITPQFQINFHEIKKKMKQNNINLRTRTFQTYRSKSNNPPQKYLSYHLKISRYDTNTKKRPRNADYVDPTPLFCRSLSFLSHLIQLFLCVLVDEYQSQLFFLSCRRIGAIYRIGHQWTASKGPF